MELTDVEGLFEHIQSCNPALTPFPYAQLKKSGSLSDLRTAVAETERAWSQEVAKLKVACFYLPCRSSHVLVAYAELASACLRSLMDAEPFSRSRMDFCAVKSFYSSCLVRRLQEIQLRVVADHLARRGTRPSECVVCFEEQRDFVQPVCTHEICGKCFVQMKRNTLGRAPCLCCPLCRRPFVVLS